MHQVIAIKCPGSCGKLGDWEELEGVAGLEDYARENLEEG